MPVPNPKDDELRADATAIFGRFSSNTTPPDASTTLESLLKMVFEGSNRLQPYLERFKPEVTVKVEISLLENGSKAVRLERRERSLVMPIGEALLSQDAYVENEFSELFHSVCPSAIVLNTVAYDPEAPADKPDRPLLRLALSMLAINEITDPYWNPAEGCNLEAVGDRRQIRDALTTGEGRNIHPAEVILAPSDSAVAFDPALVEGASKALDVSDVEKMYHDTRVALLNVEPPDGSNYVEYLGTLRSEFRCTLEKCVKSVQTKDPELVRNWIGLAMLITATPDTTRVRVVDVPGEWMVRANDKELTPVAGSVRVEGRSAPEELFRTLVVARDASDQSQAVSKVVAAEPISDPRALKHLGEWARNERVVVYASLVQSSLEGLKRAIDPIPNGIQEPWAQHVTIACGGFNLDLGTGIMISLPANVVQAAGQSVLDRRMAVEGAAVSELANACAGNQHKLLDLEGGARMVAGVVSKRNARTIETFVTDSVIHSVTRTIVNVIVQRDGGDGFAMNGCKTLWRDSKKNSPNRAFEDVASVRVRNHIVKTIDRHLRKHYLKSSIDESRQKELEGKLNEWIKSLDDHKSKRHLINAKESKVSVTLQDGNQLKVVVTLCYKNLVDRISVDDRAITERLDYQLDEDLGVWIPAEIG